jgi:spore coat protein JB
MDENKEAMLMELMAVDFAVIEFNLYLDTHPNDLRALEMYNMNVQKSRMLRDKYEMQYGPLTARYSKSASPWQWIRNPWPWSKDFMTYGR